VIIKGSLCERRKTLWEEVTCVERVDTDSLGERPMCESLVRCQDQETKVGTFGEILRSGSLVICRDQVP
jgi:hypothetical protein